MNPKQHRMVQLIVPKNTVKETEKCFLVDLCACFYSYYSLYKCFRQMIETEGKGWTDTWAIFQTLLSTDESNLSTGTKKLMGT